MKKPIKSESKLTPSNKKEIREIVREEIKDPTMREIQTKIMKILEKICERLTNIEANMNSMILMYGVHDERLDTCENRLIKVEKAVF